MSQLLEPQIKAMLINKLLESGKIKNDSIIINEFTIDGASRRVDLALISGNHLEAFEIKSEADSLTRLQGQASKYLEYFDKVTVISAEKHTKRIENQFDEKIALWEISNKKFKVIKRGKKTPLRDKNKIISLMNVSDLKSLAKDLGIKPYNYKRKNLESALSDAPAYILRNAALNSIRQRYETTYLKFSTKTLGRTVSSDDLQFLSPQKQNTKKDKEDPSIKSLVSSIGSIPLSY